VKRKTTSSLSARVPPKGQSLQLFARWRWQYAT